MKSLWSSTFSHFPTKELNTDLTGIDTLVIGGGMCGILTAYQLSQKGHRTVVLEAERTGSGQTHCTTAKITAQHALIYDSLLQEAGFEAAKQYADANLLAIKRYRELADSLNISCNLEILPSVLYTLSADTTALEREYNAARSLGIECSLQKSSTLPFDTTLCLSFGNQAQFNPMPFLYALADKLEIYEKSRVRDVKEHTAITDKGSVTAENIVFATHYPFRNFPGLYFTKMHRERSYVIALKNAGTLDGMYYGIDEDGLSFRYYDSFMLMGGQGHRTGKSGPQDRYSWLERQAKNFWPDCVTIGRWSAQDCISVDKIPYIGRYSKKYPYWFVATGFKKWGMTSSMAAAEILCDLIDKGSSPYAGVFAPDRKFTASSRKNLAKELLQSSIGLGKEFLTWPLSGLEDIAPGDAKIVHYKGRKLGIYKDMSGNIFPVSARCPHLGCQLSWNPNDRSWDCPCHGSRFDYKGRLLDNPAQKDIIKA